VRVLADNLEAMSTLAALDLQSPAAVCDVLDAAAKANAQTPGRTGSVVDLGRTGKLTISGDLHDHTLNFERLLKLARLEKSADHHVILQELIHGEHYINGMDLSYRALVKAAALKAQFPAQVHYLLSNHELAQVCGDGILKDGVSVVEAFNEGLEYVFGDEAKRVAQRLDDFVRSMPLAVRCANGVFCSHSLPPPRKREVFDTAVLLRPMTTADYEGPAGSAHLMVWGRGLTQKLADDLGSLWNVKQFVLGHQPAEMGYDECGQTMLIVNSDHDHGVALTIDLAKHYDRDQLIERIVPLNGVTV
jgi:hypothetical protein